MKIGISQRIRSLKPPLEQSRLTDEVERDVSPGELIVRAAHPARQGWDAQFQEMAQAGEDVLLNPELLTLTTWESDEWSW